MGDINQTIYLDRYLQGDIVGAVLEIGSKDYGNTSSFRNIYPENEYVGLDMESGKGVDIIQDLTTGIGELQEKYFDLIICCSVLEHVKKPWVMAENLQRLLKPGGVLYISVPWVWRYHAYPDDYFRFSWRGIIELFQDLECKNACYSTNVQGEIVEITGDNKYFDNNISAMVETTRGKRKYLPYLMVNMLCYKK